MAIFSATTEGEQSVTSAAGRIYFALQGAADVHAKLVEFGVSFDGTTSSDGPILVELYQTTTAGTGATALTEIDISRLGGTAKVAATRTTASGAQEPSAGSRIANWQVHPQGGNLVIQYPLGREPVICANSASQGLAIKLTAPTIGTTNYTAYALWEE